MTSRKIWDTYSGNVLHSFPHNHIVRSVAISPSSSHLLTGGQEKKVRIFDLGRPDAEPDFLTQSGSLAHDGTVKSVVWVGEDTGVSAGEDGVLKCVARRSRFIFFSNLQVVGSTCTRADHQHYIPKGNYIYGAVPTNWKTRSDFWQHCLVHSCAAKYWQYTFIDSAVFPVVGVDPSDSAGPVCYGQSGRRMGSGSWHGRRRKGSIEGPPWPSALC